MLDIIIIIKMTIGIIHTKLLFIHLSWKINKNKI